MTAGAAPCGADAAPGIWNEPGMLNTSCSLGPSSIEVDTVQVGALAAPVPVRQLWRATLRSTTVSPVILVNSEPPLPDNEPELLDTLSGLEIGPSWSRWIVANVNVRLSESRLLC